MYYLFLVVAVAAVVLFLSVRRKSDNPSSIRG